MNTETLAPLLAQLFSELVDGVAEGTGAFMLNSGDVGLLRSLDKLSSADASQSANDGATIAAHAQHVRYGLSLMNRWAREGGNPFANADWGEAWTITRVDDDRWKEIRHGLGEETRRWKEALSTPRDAQSIEVTGMISSIGHLAYHLGAIRQISKALRGPREGAIVPTHGGVRQAQT